MAEELISCNWVDPKRMRQAQPRCWLGTGSRCLSRTGVPVSAGTAAPTDGLCPRTQLGAFHWGRCPSGEAGPRAGLQGHFGVHTLSFMVPPPDIPPSYLVLSWTWGSRMLDENSSLSQGLFIPSLGQILLNIQRACPTPSQPCWSGPGDLLLATEQEEETLASSSRCRLPETDLIQARMLRFGTPRGFGRGVSGCKAGFQRLPCFLRRISGTEPKASLHPRALAAAGVCGACSTSLQLLGGLWGVSLPPTPGTPTLQPLVPADHSSPHTDKGSRQNPVSQQKGLKCPFWMVPDSKEELPPNKSPNKSPRRPS